MKVDLGSSDKQFLASKPSLADFERTHNQTKEHLIANEQPYAPEDAHYYYKRRIADHEWIMTEIKNFIESLTPLNESDGSNITSISLGDLIKSPHLRVVALAIEKYLENEIELQDQGQTIALLNEISKTTVAKILSQSFIKPDGNYFSAKKIANRDNDSPLTKKHLQDVMDTFSKIAGVINEELKEEEYFSPRRKG